MIDVVLVGNDKIKCQNGVKRRVNVPDLKFVIKNGNIDMDII